MNQSNVVDEILPVVQRYLKGTMIFLCFIGFVSNLFTCFIFTRRKHRQNACSIFCSATSATNGWILLQAIVETSLTLLFNEDPENFNSIYCKTRLYIRHALVMTNRTFTILSCAACFALTSKRTNFRQILQRRKFCYRIILATSIFWFGFCSHLLIFTKFENARCTSTENYKLAFAIYLFILAGSISPALMILFSLLVLKNLRDLRSRIRPVANSFHLKKRDLQLIRMLLTQIIIYLLSTFLYPVDLLYASVRSENFNRGVVERFLTFLTNDFLFYLNNVAPFFTYYLTSSSFRSEVHSFRLDRHVFFSNSRYI